VPPGEGWLGYPGRVHNYCVNVTFSKNGYSVKKFKGGSEIGNDDVRLSVDMM